MFRKCLALLPILAITGCDIDFRPIFGIDTNAPTSGKALLKQFESEQELRDYIRDQSQAMSRGGFGGGFIGDSDDSLGLPVSGPEPAPTANDAAGGDDSGQLDGGSSTQNESSGDPSDPQFSQTTEQEEGVQEADVLKTDGSFIYVMSEGVLRIVQADPTQLAELGSVELNGYGSDLYLRGDRAVAITSPNAFAVRTAQVGTDIAFPSPEFFQPQTEVTVIDIADRSNPRVLSRSRMDGSIHASRMIDDRLYLVIYNFPNNFIPEFDEAPLEDILPDIAIQTGDDQPTTRTLAGATDHYRPVDADGFGFTTVVSMDIHDPTGYDAQTIVAEPSNVYASTEALYLTNSEFKFDGSFRESTSIYKFDFTESGVILAAGGQVPGRVLNQYSMGEYQGFLRLATTDRRDSFTGSRTANNVYVLEQIEDRLEQAGSVEGLAPGESIFSARFIGDRGYLVTFEQIDPLFTLDLSDPRNPKAVGELKVPGFSTFIVPMGDDHLLTIGRDTSDDFGFVRSEGVRLSIFDVSDFANPQLAHFETIGTNGGSSEALYNAKAFTYFAAGDLVAFPMDIYDFGDPFFGPIDIIQIDEDPSGADGTAASDGAAPPDEGEIDGVAPDADFAPQPVDQFTGLYVYRVTPDAGFDFLGRISTQPAGAAGDRFFPAFTRGVFINDMVYTVTSLSVQTASLSDITNPVARVQFPLPEFDEPFPIPVDAPGAPTSGGGVDDSGGTSSASSGGGSTGSSQGAAPDTGDAP